MSKTFIDVLTDGFNHVTEFADNELLTQLRDEGVRVDDEGIYTFSFGEHKEYLLTVEPLGKEDQYQIGIYKNHIPINLKLPIWNKTAY